jgi:GDPmannose 4,6-dehydratase
MHASNGILFNHESPIRGETFVTRKVTRGLSRIALGMQEMLYLGNLSSQRDWGHAKDYIEAMYLILQQDEPDDYVIATGITTTIRDFVKRACAEIGIQLQFEGTGVDEYGFIQSIDQAIFNEKVGAQFYDSLKAKIEKKTAIVAVDPAYFRPTEVELLIGDPTKSKSKLGWKPKYDLQALITDMMQADIHLFKKDDYLKKGGYKINNYFE